MKNSILSLSGVLLALFTGALAVLARFMPATIGGVLPAFEIAWVFFVLAIALGMVALILRYSDGNLWRNRSNRR